MNTAMEMHDSYLLELRTGADGSGFALFQAVVWRSEGVLGQDAEESGWQNVRMQFTDMIIEGNWRDAKPYASDGFLSLNGNRDNGFIIFPMSYTGSVVLSMDLSDDFETTTVRGTSVSIVAEGEFEREHVWDAEGNRIPGQT